MKRFGLLLMACCLLGSSATGAQSCPAKALNDWNDWLPIAQAPRDGRVIEAVQTSGLAPSFGLVRWQRWKGSGAKAWVSATDHNLAVWGEECLLWRPYLGKVSHYIDPTHGKQYTVAYWCRAAGLTYDRQQDRCETKR